MTDTNDVEPEEPLFHEILTARLRLRTVRLSDVESLMPLLTCYDVMKWTSQGPVSNVEQGKKWLSTRCLGKDVFNFAIEQRQETAAPTPIIGIIGCYHLPEVGYLIHPGKGYATEALEALLPEVFERFPGASEGGIGFDYIEGWTDVSNIASRKVLEKCGFEHCETVADPDNQIRGPSELFIYRKARPGMTLEGLGLIAAAKAESPAPAPPVE